MLSSVARRDEVSVVDDQRGSPTYVGHLAEATREVIELPYGTYHVAADGDCTWADFAEAIFEEAGLDCRVRRITTAEFARPAPRPAYSVLRSEKPGAPSCPTGATASGLPRRPAARRGLRRSTRSGAGHRAVGYASDGAPGDLAGPRPRLQGRR